MNTTAARYKWYLVTILSTFVVLNYAARFAISSVFPLLEKDILLDEVKEGKLLTAFGLCYGLFSPFAGAVVDRISRKTIIFSSLIIWSVICVATGFAEGFTDLMILRAAEGTAQAFYFPAAVSIMSDYHTHSRSRALGIHQGGLYVGIVAGSIFAGVIANAYGWRASFILLGTVGILWGIVTFRFVIEPARIQSSNISSSLQGYWAFLRLVFNNPVTLLLIAAFFCSIAVSAVLLQWMPKFLYEQYRFSLPRAATFATAFVQPASIVGAFLGGWQADNAAQKRKSGRIMVQGCALLCATPFVYLSGSVGSIHILIFAMTIWGLFKGAYDANIFASVYDFTKLEYRGSIVGLMNMVGWAVSVAVFAPLSGYFAQRYSLGYVISMSSLGYVLGGALLILATRYAGRK